MYLVIMKRRNGLLDVVVSGKLSPFHEKREDAEKVVQEMREWFPDTLYFIQYVSIPE